eukprot:COSAG02_NODE_20753_length_817_cov_0.768802_2_plen_146_part_01
MERLREVVAAARANPDMGPAHAHTTEYAAVLAKWEALAAKLEARELRFNLQSPWTCATNKGRAYYWRNPPYQTTLEAPAEGVKNLAEKTDEEFNKRWPTLQRRQALLLQFSTHLNFESPWTCATNKGRAFYWRRGSAEELAARHEG